MEEATQQPVEIKTPSKNLSKFIIIAVVILGFISTFVSGYYLSTLSRTENNVTTATPKPPSDEPQLLQDTTKFLPGKHYFDDTIMVITKDKPQLSLVATVTRAEQEKDYAQGTRVSYFDGSNWTRLSDAKTISDSAIVSGKLVKSWSTTIDPSRVLKQTAQGEINVNGSSLSFSTGILQNEIGIRSLPGYTKFLSYGTGTLTVNGTAHNAYILYTRIYSLNAADIQFYNQPFGVTTDYLAFWDTQGNFYHVDSTFVDKPTPTYQTHQLGVLEDTQGTVTKTFSTSIDRGSENPPVSYTINMGSPIGATLRLSRINGINKAPNGSYTWYMGNVDGTVTKPNGETLSGVGLIEYIHN